MNTDLWDAERDWWLNGAAEAALHMAPNCIMVFPEGVLQGGAIIDGLASAPRWREITMTERHMAETNQVRVLSYVARAQRGDAPVRHVRCSSCWVRLDRWRLICHQQTPI